MWGSLETPVWDAGGGTGYPVLPGHLRAPVCVVGLGGSGLTCIQELARRGIAAVGLDRGRVGGGAAGRNGGIILAGPADFHQRAAAHLGRARAAGLYRATLNEIDRWRAESPGVIQATGSLRIAADGAEFADCEAQHEAMRADDLPVEMYEGEEGRGLLIPGDGVFQPLERCRLLAEKVTAAGARLHEHTTVRQIAPGRVSTDQGTVHCDRVVVAVDGGLERLLPGLADRVRSARIQMLATAPDRAVEFPRPVYSRWGYDFWRQLADGRIVLGGLRDAGGPAEWTLDGTPTESIQRRLNYLLHRIGVRAPVTHRWAGVAAYTREGLPVFQETAKGVLVLGAYSGTGNVMGALLGREAASWAAGHETPLSRLLEVS